MACHNAPEALANAHAGVTETFASAPCIDCHMPLRRTDDVVHVAMTDHRIARRKPRRDLLAPLREKTDLEQRYQGEVLLYFPQQELPGGQRDLYLGIAQVKEKANLQAGVSLLERALRKEQPPYPEPYFELAEAQAASGDRKSAIASYRATLTRDPAFVHAANNLGNLLAEEQRYTEAIEHYRRALELDPASADIATNLGLALLDSGDPSGAIAAFRAAASAHATYAEAHFNLGSLLLAQGSVDEAQTALATALAIEPAHAKANHNMGLALLALGQPREAVRFFKVALAEGDESVRASAGQRLRQMAQENP
jgi:tetratricopeptide (TPR) repeat protein